MTGGRIKQARIVAGLTLDEVATQLSILGHPISKQGLSNYEKGKRNPKPDTLIKLAKVFGVKTDYFLVNHDTEVVLEKFRCQATLRKTQEEEIKALAADHVEKVVFLKDIFNESEASFIKDKPIVRRSEDAEQAAEDVRREWNLGLAPIRSLTRTIEDHGAIVVDHRHEDAKFDGLSGWTNKKNPVIVVNCNRSVDRIRLSLGHELGHLVMKCHGVSDKEQEKFAFRFSGAFLMPDSVAYNELGQKRKKLFVQELAGWKRQFGMSMSSILYRAKDLGIITESYFKGMMIFFRKKGWHINEPYEIKMQEEPHRLQQMALRAYAEGIITAERAEQLFPGCTSEVEPEECDILPPLNPIELMKYPKQRRERFLRKQAIEMQHEYENNPDLSGFDAFGEADLLDDET